MFERDYMVRMFIRFAQELARLINREQTDKEYDFTQDLNGLFQRYTGIDAGFAERLDTLDLLEIFDGTDQSGAGKALIAAEIWAFLYANLLNQGDIDRADHLQRMSIEMYAAAMQRDTEFISTPSFKKALQVLEALPIARWSVGVAEAAVFLYEQDGQYAKAEDALHILVDRELEGSLAFAETFYLRLTQLDDKLLDQGNLPRAEVLEGLAEVQRKI